MATKKTEDQKKAGAAAGEVTAPENELKVAPLASDDNVEETEEKNLSATAEREKAEEENESSEESAVADTSGAEDEDPKVDSVEDVLQPTGGAFGGLEESKAKEEEMKEEAQGDEHTEKKRANVAKKREKAASGEEGNKEGDPEGPFANSAVAGGTGEKTFGQQAQLYTDGLSGGADSNLDRAYGSGPA